MRLALGAGRWRLVRQLVGGKRLAFDGGRSARTAIGVLCTHLLFAEYHRSQSIHAATPPGNWVGAAVLLFTFAVSLATEFCLDFVPAIQFSRPDLAFYVEGRRGASAASRTPWHQPVGSCRSGDFVDAAGWAAGLMIRSFARLGAVDAGFDPHNVLTMRVVLTGSSHAALRRKRNVFYRQALTAWLQFPESSQ